MFDGLKFEPDPSCVRAGFRNRLYEGNDHTAETSTPRQCRALAGRCVLHPPHFAMLFLSAEPANSWIVGLSANRKLGQPGTLLGVRLLVTRWRCPLHRVQTIARDGIRQSSRITSF